MAVPAVDPQLGHVVLVAERDGLRLDHVLPGHVMGTQQLRVHPGEEGEEEDPAEDAHLGDRIGAAMEDLRHPRALPPRPCRAPYPSPALRSSDLVTLVTSQGILAAGRGRCKKGAGGNGLPPGVDRRYLGARTGQAQGLGPYLPCCYLPLSSPLRLLGKNGPRQGSVRAEPLCLPCPPQEGPPPGSFATLAAFFVILRGDARSAFEREVLLQQEQHGKVVDGGG